MSRHVAGPPTEAEGPGKSADESWTDVRVHEDRDRYGDSAQLTIDDALEDARRARDNGHTEAIHGTDVQWREAFDTVLERLARTCETLTVYDVLDEVGFPPAGSSQAFGALMSAAARRGVITKTGAVVQSPKSSRNGALLLDPWVTGSA